MKVTNGFKKGYYVWSNKEITSPYFYPMQGQIIARDDIREDFIDYVNTLYKGTESFCSLDEYNETLEKYNGTCGKFVWNDENKYLKLPTMKVEVEKSIETFDLNELNQCLENYVCCYCYPGISNNNEIIYDKAYLNVIRECEYKDVWQETISGYFYLLIKDLDIEYRLSTEIPKLIMVVKFNND